MSYIDEVHFSVLRNSMKKLLLPYMFTNLPRIFTIKYQIYCIILWLLIKTYSLRILHRA